MRLSLGKAEVNSWIPENPGICNLRKWKPKGSLEPSSEGPKRHNAVYVAGARYSTVVYVHGARARAPRRVHLKRWPWDARRHFTLGSKASIRRRCAA